MVGQKKFHFLVTAMKDSSVTTSSSWPRFFVSINPKNKQKIVAM